jgi:hypothetical protein
MAVPAGPVRAAPGRTLRTERHRCLLCRSGRLTLAYVKLLSRDLASDAESHVTGAADIVDGGLSSAP